MRTVYKYIHFTQDGRDWVCRNSKNNTLLGEVIFYSRWKQHIIMFEPDCVFNTTCLLDIADFLKQLNKEEKPK